MTLKTIWEAVEVSSHVISAIKKNEGAFYSGQFLITYANYVHSTPMILKRNNPNELVCSIMIFILILSCLIPYLTKKFLILYTATNR
jgi:hypothetical protein